MINEKIIIDRDGVKKEEYFIHFLVKSGAHFCSVQKILNKNSFSEIPATIKF